MVPNPDPSVVARLFVKESEAPKAKAASPQANPVTVGWNRSGQHEWKRNEHNRGDLLLPPKCVCLLAVCSLGWLLEEPAPCAVMEWEKTKTSLTLRDGQRVVWRFSAALRWQAIFHLVTLPDGMVATDRRPADHTWHLGVGFTFNKLNGVNFWGESEDGRIWGPDGSRSKKSPSRPPT